MEPMTLGTPNTSFNTSLFDTSSAANTQFLPSFLLGNDHGNTSICTSRLPSPDKSQFSKFQSQSSPIRNTSYERYSLPNVTSPAEKHDGPPIISLADYSTVHSIDDTNSNFSINVTQNNSKGFIEEDHSENWVTIFGFSPSQLDLVLSYFARFGHIVDKKHSLNGGNWIRVKYSNRREAQLALSQNGKQISPNLIIGVVSRKDKHNLDNISNRSLLIQSKTDFPTKQAVISPSHGSTIRRLTVTNNENDVISLTSVPTKSSGMVSKTMEYLFGW